MLRKTETKIVKIKKRKKNNYNNNKTTVWSCVDRHLSTKFGVNRLHVFQENRFADGRQTDGWTMDDGRSRHDCGSAVAQSRAKKIKSLSSHHNLADKHMYISEPRKQKEVM